MIAPEDGAEKSPSRSRSQTVGVSIPATFRLRYASHLGIQSTDEPLFQVTLGNDDPVLHIEYAAAQGFSGIQDNFLKARTAAEQKRIGEAITGLGLEMGCFLSDVGPRRPIWGMTGDEAEAHLASELSDSIEVARRVGGRYIVIAAARDLRLPLRLQQMAMTKHLRRLAPMAERAGVILCVEQTSEPRVPGMLIHHIADALAVVEAATSPAVKLVFDFHHVQVMDGNLIENFDRCLPHIAAVQIADVPGRSELGLGEVNWPRVLRHVRASGYAGLVEYEVYPSRSGAEGEQAALDALRRADAAI